MKKWQIILGILLVTLGLFSLIEELVGVNLWRFVLPLILVGLGLMLILRPRKAKQGVHVQMPILGDLRKTGNWEVTQHEIWLIVGDTLLDLSTATFPQGEGSIRIIGFVNEVKIILPAHVGLQIDANAFVSEFKLPEGKQERFMSALNYQSPNFEEKDNRVTLQTLGFVSEITVRPSVL
jgi:hypothetical protein